MRGRTVDWIGFGLRAGVSAAGLAIQMLRAGRPEPRTVADRLGDFAGLDLPIRSPVTIRWSERQIPFVEADSDADLATALGAIHVHLRWTQMEIQRAIAWGETSGLIGPVGREIDDVLRRIDFTAAVPEMQRCLDDQTGAWLAAFVAGINAAVAALPALPPDFPVLGLTRRPWTAADVLAIGRLAGADFAWTAWPALLACRRDAPDWPALWRRFAAATLAPPPPEDTVADQILTSLSRAGSNIVVAPPAPGRGGLLANDTHLGIGVPNAWILVGCRAPGFPATVGQMVPGLPIIPIGRSADGRAWGGANLQSANSDPVAVGSEETTVSTTPRRTRWWPDGSISIRRTRLGPVISDSKLFPARPGEAIALAWTGHRPSDDLRAFHALARGTCAPWPDAAQAINAPALAVGTVDQRNARLTTATLLPPRPAMPADDLVLDATSAAFWSSLLRRPTVVDATAHPGAPALVHANHRPPGADHGFGRHFSAEDRLRRLVARINGTPGPSLDRLRAMQLDVTMPSAIGLRDAILAAIRRVDLAPSGSGDAALLAALAEWDGRFDAGSSGALAYHLIVAELLKRLHAPRPRAARVALRRVPNLLSDDLRDTPPEKLRRLLPKSFHRAGRRWRRWKTWGRFHRIRLQHPLGHMPVLGRWWRLADLPAEGSIDTVNQSSHGYGSAPHSTGFGAVSRFVADTGDRDETYAVLLGGQDGWIGSTTAADQIDLWASGEMIRLPLSPEAVARNHPHVITLVPST